MAVFYSHVCRFLRSCDRERFESAWCSHAHNMDITVRLCSAGMDFTELGRHALRRTGAARALCLGGGQVVVDEVAANPHVAFRVFPCARGSPPERTPLESEGRAFVHLPQVTDAAIIYSAPLNGAPLYTAHH